LAKINSQHTRVKADKKPSLKNKRTQLDTFKDRKRRMDELDDLKNAVVVMDQETDVHPKIDQRAFSCFTRYAINLSSKCKSGQSLSV
jgi:hypothetical protein